MEDVKFYMPTCKIQVLKDVLLNYSKPFIFFYPRAMVICYVLGVKITTPILIPCTLKLKNQLVNIETQHDQSLPLYAWLTYYNGNI
jgi:hypothetical protein